MSATSKLLPCPHCGEAEHLYPSYRNMGAGEPYAIDCLGCGADYTPRDGMDVIAMWNRRPTTSSETPSEAVMRLVTEAISLAPKAGLFLKIRIEPAKAEGRP